METQEDNFNERFRNEMAGSAGLMGIDDVEEDKSDVEFTEPSKVFKS